MTPATPNGPQDSLATVSHTRSEREECPGFRSQVGLQAIVLAARRARRRRPTDQATKLANVRKSVLDSVLADGAALEKKLGAADKQRVEQHLDAIRAIEQRLRRRRRARARRRCARSPTAPTTGKDTNSEAPPAVNTAMADLSALALACDRTRVLTFVFSLPAAHVYYRHLGSNMNADFHDTICQVTPVTVESAARRHGRALRDDLPQRVLDQDAGHGPRRVESARPSLVFVTSDTAWGKTHTKTEWPVLLAGKAGRQAEGRRTLQLPRRQSQQGLVDGRSGHGFDRHELGSGAGA